MAFATKEDGQLDVQRDARGEFVLCLGVRNEAAFTELTRDEREEWENAVYCGYEYYFGADPPLPQGVCARCLLSPSAPPAAERLVCEYDGCESVLTAANSLAHSWRGTLHRCESGHVIAVPQLEDEAVA